MKPSKILFGIGAFFTVLWILEQITIGKGVVSTYLAPFAFGPLIISSIMRIKENQSKD